MYRPDAVFDVMLWRTTLAPNLVSVGRASWSLSITSTCLLIVDGRVAPRCACSFWELIGRKKADEETEGTWLRLAALAGRAPFAVELDTALPARLVLFPFAASPWRSGMGCGQAAGTLCEDIADLVVPACDGPWLCLCVSCSLPSSVPMSVIREETMLGGPPPIALPGY